MLKLLSVLHTWQPTGCLGLELSAFPPPATRNTGSRTIILDSNMKMTEIWSNSR
ncbi:hypothetical protein BKA67DRAFT_565678 [Truncatella angustata]|uniref:Uncharacterized protein n=1 Tax=Truncatella angustata TaxID=152316 RepID=A0A9P8UL77_9PEZI|nr:uncharacterized protein BKA67DRAFT_565678 [Truncatella angustata]KAH6654595.1 hypothetical protein BKA67DRAFT_565678 [Truncatella angustata]